MPRRMGELTSETGASSPSRVRRTAATPVITAAPKVQLQRLGERTADFVLGPDTCGFTSGTTITCTHSTDYCVNVGDYRGCCAGSPEQCSATIYTTCQDNLFGAFQAHVLYCTDEDAPACMTHYFTTDAAPGSTYTNVACGATALFGQLYPFPPELMPTTSAADGAANGTSTATPTDDSNESSGGNEGASGGISSGALAGAIIGAALVVLIVAAAIALVARHHRRRRRGQQHGGHGQDPAAGRGRAGVGVLGGRMDDKDGGEAGGSARAAGDEDVAGLSEAERRRRLLLRLSTIQEQPGVVSVGGGGVNNPHAGSPRRSTGGSASLFSHGRKPSTSPSVSGSPSARRAYGPEWPLGSADPLESHPVDMREVQSTAAATTAAATAGVQSSSSRSGSISSEALPPELEKRLSQGSLGLPSAPPAAAAATTNKSGLPLSDSPPPAPPPSVSAGAWMRSFGSRTSRARASVNSFGGAGSSVASQLDEDERRVSQPDEEEDEEVVHESSAPAPPMPNAGATVVPVQVVPPPPQQQRQLPSVVVQPPSLRSAVAAADEVSPIEDDDEDDAYDSHLDGVGYADYVNFVDTGEGGSGSGSRPQPTLARLSLVSVESMHQQQDGDELISPVSFSDVLEGEGLGEYLRNGERLAYENGGDADSDGYDDGRVSPLTIPPVSPLESPRDSPRRSQQ